MSQADDLTTRFAAAVAMIAGACAAIYIGGWPFRLLVAAVAAIMLLEWGDMHKVGRVWTYLAMALLAGGLLAVAWRLFPPDQIDYIEGIGAAIDADSFRPALSGAAAIAGLAVLAGLVSRRLSLAWGLVYVGIPAFGLIVLEWARFDIVFWLMLVTWSSDIFAYVAGRAIGGPKLAPAISPNKTWAGLIGGMAGAAVVGAVAAYAFDLGPVFLLAGAPMGLIAQLGDLYESRVKRRAGVKDSGTLLPAHGGVLDRLDGLLPVIVATLALLMVSLGSA